MNGSHEPNSLGIILIGHPDKTKSVSHGLRRHPNVTIVATAESAEYAYGITRRCIGEGLPVDAIFLDPFADRYDPHKSSLFILETRTEHPEIAFVLLTSPADLRSNLPGFPPELRERINHYYRIDPSTSGTRFDAEIDRAVDDCDSWHAAAGQRPRRVRHKYDVALSFAGEDRDFAREIASILTSRGIRVFYDYDQQPSLWGKNLFTRLYDIYAYECRFCIILVSAAYRDSMWTNHERSAAQARALQTREADYILPVRLEDVTIPGLPPTIAYVPAQLGAEEIANLFIRKLAAMS